MKQLFTIHNTLVKEVAVNFKSFIYEKIDWELQLISIKGARGVGKTTLLLQYIKENYATSQEALYASLDNLYFTAHSLYKVAEQFSLLGGTHLFLDEVHKYENWAIEVKNIYDSIPSLKVVVTSSSAVKLLKGEADLSRRMINYQLPGLSYREYLNFEFNTKYSAILFEDLIHNHKEIAAEMLKSLKPIKSFNNYLTYGYYPYFKEDVAHYNQRLLNTINLILELDIPQIEKINYQSINQLKKLLYIISQNVPFKPNISKLAVRIGITRNTLLHYLHYLEQAEVLSSLKKNTRGISLLSKPEKIFLQNTNLMHALSEKEEVNIGSKRETFFYNQVGYANTITYSAKADFYVNDKYTFEIGGKNKNQNQIKGVKNAFVVSDNMEVGYFNNIPLWLFGFLY